METACPGCGVRLPAVDFDVDRRIDASPACWLVNGEVVGFELRHPVLYGRFHQLAVDTYGAQHAGSGTAAIRVGYSLVGLDLALERGLTGDEIRDVHRWMGHPDGSWPVLTRPAPPAPITALDVAVAGARANDVDGHARAMPEWAAAVWRSWAGQHGTIREFTDRMLARRYAQPTRPRHGRR
jgi:hypothetical protein